jgi:hypothetical protein
MAISNLGLNKRVPTSAKDVEAALAQPNCSLSQMPAAAGPVDRKINAEAKPDHTINTATAQV